MTSRPEPHDEALAAVLARLAPMMSWNPPSPWKIILPRWVLDRAGEAELLAAYERQKDALPSGCIGFQVASGFGPGLTVHADVTFPWVAQDA